jgi:hypothetical protein
LNEEHKEYSCQVSLLQIDPGHGLASLLFFHKKLASTPVMAVVGVLMAAAVLAAAAAAAAGAAEPAVVLTLERRQLNASQLMKLDQDRLIGRGLMRGVVDLPVLGTGNELLAGGYDYPSSQSSVRFDLSLSLPICANHARIVQPPKHLVRMPGEHPHLLIRARGRGTGPSQAPG